MPVLIDGATIAKLARRDWLTYDSVAGDLGLTKSAAKNLVMDLEIAGYLRLGQGAVYAVDIFGTRRRMVSPPVFVWVE